MGAIVAGIGLLFVLLAAASLPWASVGGEGITRSDIADNYEAVQEADLDEVDFVGEYATWGWVVVTVLMALAVLFSTLVVPTAKAGRLVIGFLLGSIVGLAVNAADDDGRFGPRVTGALAVFGAAAIHAFAQFLLLTETIDGDPDVGSGVWVGAIGVALVLTGCAIGTRFVQAPAVPAAGLPAPGSARAYGYR